MSFSNIFFKILSFIIGLAVFGFYIYVINHFTNGDVLEFPYLILTIYFSFCMILFPFIALTENKVINKLKFLSNKTMYIVMFALAPIIFFKTRKNPDSTES
ncbi:hypothetical protein JEHA107958_10345 [Jeotgalicoccus halotolerans]|uniref:Uncharacterized protein n=1 Tax=Jeotgalicoccus halotolerans TaxID=157227 RepID=A0A3E0B363_9STAP|nr:hypothetical protein DFR63_0022 [Jeotgalicoccus halotolerans]